MSASSLADLAEEALRTLDQALGKPPAELKAEVGVALRAITALRDELVIRVRQSPSDEVRSTLDRVNVALSLIIGVEYPAGGLQRELLENARMVLAAAPGGSVWYAPLGRTVQTAN